MAKDWAKARSDFEAHYAKKNAKKGAKAGKPVRKKEPKALAKLPNLKSGKDLAEDVKRRTAAASKPAQEESITAYREESTKKKIGMKRGMGRKSARDRIIESQILEQMPISVSDDGSKLSHSREETLMERNSNEKLQGQPRSFTQERLN